MRKAGIQFVLWVVAASACSTEPTAPGPISSVSSHVAAQRQDARPFSGAANGAPTVEQLMKAGWDCGTPPVPGLFVCGTPGLGRPPFPPQPNGRPHYEIVVFTASGVYVGRSHFLRADLYHGQPCAGSGQPYDLRPIGYYECFIPA